MKSFHIVLCLASALTVSGVCGASYKSEQPHKRRHGGLGNNDDRAQIQDLTRQLWKDIGLKEIPDMEKINISDSEYSRMFLVYQRSVLQTEILQNLQDEIAEIEEEESEEKSSPPISHHVFAASEKKGGDDNNSVRNKRSSLDLELNESLLLRSKFPLLRVSEENEGDSLLLVHSADLHLSLSVEEKKNQHLTSEVTLRVRQLLLTSGSNEEEEEGVIVESATFKVKELMQQLQEEEGEEEEESEFGVEMDISHTVQLWMTEPGMNQGLVVECTGCEAAGVVLKGKPSLRVQLQRRARPAYAHPLSSGGRQKRSYFHSHIQARRRNRVDCKADSELISNGKGRKKKQRCCRKKMEVNFSELSGFEHILQPHTFDAFYCDGRCPIRFNPANGHALLQSLLHVESRHGRAKHSATIPKPCCAPSKMLPLPILHLSGGSEHKLEVTHWKNVIVGECKCT